MNYRKLNFLTDLLVNKVITKVVNDELIDVAEVLSIENNSYVGFDGVPVKNPSKYKNKMFGCSINLLNFEETLKINGIDYFK